MSSDGGGVGRRVVITGMGLVTPVGNDVEAAWSALVAGRSGAAPITLFDAGEEFSTRFACEVDDFDPSRYLAAKEIRRYDRFAQFGLTSVGEAMDAAGLEGVPESLPPERMGVIFGSGIGGIATFEDQMRTYLERGPGRVSPFFIPMFIPDIAAGLISIRYGAQGPNYATVSACASSAHAVGEAFRLIQTGETDVMIAGGSEATITPMAVAGFSSMKALSSRNDAPEMASRPFDADRDGFVMGEGSGTVVLETLEHALERGVEPVAELVGYGQSADAHHITSPAPEGTGAQIAMQAALDDCAIGPDAVDYINAHGTSTPQNDATETAAIKAVFGDHAHEIVVGSTKSMTGHLLGAAGAVETVISALACRGGVIPPTINFETPDPECDLEYAHGAAVERDVRYALSNSFGFGGHNVCLALRRWEG